MALLDELADYLDLIRLTLYDELGLKSIRIRTRTTSSTTISSLTSPSHTTVICHTIIVCCLRHFLQHIHDVDTLRADFKFCGTYSGTGLPAVLMVYQEFYLVRVVRIPLQSEAFRRQGPQWGLQGGKGGFGDLS